MKYFFKSAGKNKNEFTFESTGSLLKNGKYIRVRPQLRTILCLLLEKYPDIVTRENFFAALGWHNNQPERLNVPISDLRKVIGSGTIRTTPGTGYSITVSVEKQGSLKNQPVNAFDLKKEVENLGIIEDHNEPATLGRFKNPSAVGKMIFKNNNGSCEAVTESIILPAKYSIPKIPALSDDLNRERLAELDRRCAALHRNNEYDGAAELAISVLDRFNEDDYGLRAHWSNRAASAYRAAGNLRSASSFYGQAWSYIQTALNGNSHAYNLLFQEGQIRFGRTIVDSYLAKSAFRDAYNEYSSILEDSIILEISLGGSDHNSLELLIGRCHVKRQMAEMLRYLGDYDEALGLIRQVHRDYPESFYEERNYTLLSEADSLRLKGEVQDSLEIYTKLERVAKERVLLGFLGATLWRKSCALELAGLSSKRKECLEELYELVDIAPQKYRFMTIYAFLVGASGIVEDSNNAQVLLKKAEEYGGLSPSYLVCEYAHMALCQAEIFRSLKKTSESFQWFTKAQNSYSRIECKWGILRSWIGLKLTGEAPPLQPNCRNSLQGGDHLLLAKYDSGDEMPYGILSMNLP